MRLDANCRVCRRSLHKSSLGYHESLKHDKCPTCGRWIVGQEAVSHGCGSYTCCGKSWNKEKGYNAHKERTHGRCDICKKDWLLSNLDRHQRNCKPGAKVALRKDDALTGCAEEESTQNEHVKQYVERATQALKEEIRAIKQHLSTGEDTRLRYDLSEHVIVLEGCSVGKPITKHQYFALRWDRLCWQDTTQMFVICSSKEAREILAHSPLKVVLLVVGGSEDGAKDLAEDKLDPERYLRYLEAQRTLDVHIYRTPIQERLARRYDSKAAIALLRDPSNGPVNFLSLPAHKQNPIPSCVANLPNFDLLAADLGVKGKQNMPVNHKLAQSAQFQLLASGGAVSPAHVDPHGASLTTGSVESGEKVWTLWPGWEVEHFERYGEGNGYASAPLSLHLKAGDVIIFPWCLHAVLTILPSTEVCLMTGSMHYDSRDILNVLRRVQLQLKYPISNEGFSDEFIPTMTRIVDLWERDWRYCQWPDRAKLPEARELLRTIHEMTAAGRKRLRTKRKRRRID